MNVGIDTNNKTMVLEVVIKTPRSVQMQVRLRDIYKPNTDYTNRYATINGKKTFIIRLPQSPKQAILEVYNKKVGNKKFGEDRSFDNNIEIIPKPLLSTVNVKDTKERNVRNFIKFAQEFADRAGVLSATLPSGPSIYKSLDGKFCIYYVDMIKDEGGRPMKTPARISQSNGRIEISKYYFQKYTVPMRMAILFHEYSHFYLNTDKRNDIEADKNALLVYLGLGYPRIEAYQAFLEVFKGTDTELNRKRYEEIKGFIDKFEKQRIEVI